MAIDTAAQLGEYDTITREQYRRANGTAAANGAQAPADHCLECGKPLTDVQIKRGGKFCCHRCGGAYNARQPAKPKTIETPMSRPEGWDHPAPAATPGETTAASAGAAPAAEKRVPETAGAGEGGPPLRAADSPVHPDDHGLIHIAAALVDVLLAIPGTRSVEMWVGPIGPIEVRR
jgi:hypothetical protein